MKFLLDAHIPRAIGDVLNEYDCVHTSELEKGNLTKDTIINSISIQENRTLITKDTDFYYSYLANRKPYKLVLVKLGNFRLKAFIDYFTRNKEYIIEALKNHSFLILKEEKIKILD